MCVSSLSSSIKVLIYLWMVGFLVEFDSCIDTTTPPGPCRNDAAVVCRDIGSSEDHWKALTSAFSGNHQIDLIFIICNTSDCNKAYSEVISFIQSLVTLISNKYESYIDANRVHVSVIVYDSSSVRVTLNDIQKAKPTVGNCEFDKFLSGMASSKVDGMEDDATCKLPESLTEAKNIFGLSTRPSAKKILWLFSNCYCGKTDISSWRPKAELAIGDIKRGYENNVVIFTAGISQCPKGWFSTLPQEGLMKAIASSQSSHYACIDSWYNFTQMESSSVGTTNQSWSEIGKDVDIGEFCEQCANATAKSPYRCGCKVSAKQYFCHDFPLPLNSTIPVLAIALGIGIGVGLFVIIVVVIIIIIIIIVVVVPRSKRPGSAPPPLPRARVQRPPAAPPTPAKPAIYDNDDTGSIEYEILELERKMPGWSAHLHEMKQDHPLVLHLGIYSIEQDYFAQTPGFSLTQSEKMTIDSAMENGNPRKNSRKKSDVTVGSNTYVIEIKTREILSARSKDNTMRLGVVHRDGYIVVGVAEALGSEDCYTVVSEILKTVTRSDD